MNCRTGSDKANGTAPSVRACTETTGRTLRTRIAFKPAPNGVCLPQIKREHIGDAVHPGSDGTECVLLPRRNVISARPCSRIDECGSQALSLLACLIRYFGILRPMLYCDRPQSGARHPRVRRRNALIVEQGQLFPGHSCDDVSSGPAAISRAVPTR